MKTHDRRNALRFRAAPLAACVGTALLLAMGGRADAARLNYQVELTGLHSDNIDLSEDDQVEESALIPRVDFDYLSEGSRVDIEARGSFERRFYINNRYDDETRGEFAGQLDWTILPQRMSFVL